jgi:hypothetical protein
LHLEHVKLFHISNYIYAKNSLKSKEYPNAELNRRCEHKHHLYMNITKCHLKKINICDVLAKFALKWQTLI